MELVDLTKSTAVKSVAKFKDMNELRYWLAKDFKNFLYYSNNCHNLKTGRIQLAMADLLQSGDPTVLLMAFRSSSKTWVIDNYICWCWLRYIDTKIMLLSAKEKNASKHLGNIKSFLKRLPALCHLKIQSSSSTKIQLVGARVENAPSLTMAGIFSAIEGSRADKVITDDAETAINSESQLLRAKLLERLSEVEAILEPAGRHCLNTKTVPLPERTQAIYIGTPQSEYSVYYPPATLEDEEEEPHPLRMAKRLVIPAIAANGESTFPERWTNARLALKKRSMTTPRWASQMMLDPSLIDKGAAVIRFDELVVETLVPDELILTIDPAGDSGTGKDEHALCIAGPKNNKLHVKVLAGFKGLTGEQFTLKALELAAEHKVTTIIVEQTLGGYVSLFRSNNKGNFNIVGKIAKGKKITNLIDALEPTINSGKVTFDRSVLKDKTNEYQFKNFKFGSLPENDDRLDALRFAIEYYLEQRFFDYSEAFKFERASMRALAC